MAAPRPAAASPVFPAGTPVVAGVFATLIGATVIVGWIAEVDALKSIVGTITMKANAAIALIACGLSLALTAHRPSRLNVLAQSLAVLGGAIGALTLSEHVFGWNLGIDQLLFTEHPGAAATTSPGRMGPNAAISVILAGAALLLLHRGGPTAVSWSQGCGALIAVLATIPLAGYVYGARQLYDVAQFTGIAFSTAITLLILSVGILAVEPHLGVMAAFSAGGAGGVLARRLLVPAVVLPLAFAYARVLGQERNLYDTGLGIALLAISLVVVFVVLVWRTAVELNSVDAERKRVENERAQLLEREQQARAEVEQANRLKDHFLATLSHELRTPLNAILGYARMLRAGTLPPEKRPRAIDVIERNASAQNQLIDDLLDMSRLTTGRIRLEKQSIPIIAPLQEAIESVRPTAEAKGVAFDVAADPFAGTVHGDEGRLRQVFWNLLSNAVKFTPADGRISVGLNASGDSVRITVRDTGAGVAPTFLPHMFEPFRQADGGSTRRYSGLGLGLAICKQLVELHGGTIAAFSDGEGKGATFTVDLPRQIPAQARGDALNKVRSDLTPHAGSPSRPLAGLDVLVVDDEQDSRELVHEILENAGALVRTASNAAEALHEFDRRAPNLLVADIGMPEIDGCELLRQIRMRSGVRESDTPAVAVTAYARSDDRLRTMAAGFQNHVVKPIDPEVLVSTLVAAMQQRVGPADTVS